MGPAPIVPEGKIPPEDLEPEKIGFGAGLCMRQKKPRHKGGAKVSVIIAVPHLEGAVTLAVFGISGAIRPASRL